MSAKAFNYIKSFKKVLKKHVSFNIIEESDSSAMIETTPLCIGWFGTFFEISVNSEGFYSMQFYPGGKIPEENINLFRHICAIESVRMNNVKLFINEDNFLKISYDALLPDSEMLIDRELRNAFGLLNFIYKNMLPPVMLAYWKSLNKFDSNSLIDDEDDEDDEDIFDEDDDEDISDDE